MADGELVVDIVPDDEAIENIRDGEVELSTDGAMEEQTEIGEQQSEQLSVISRSLGRVLSALKQLSIIAAAVAVISKILGELLGIGFEDVRDAIVHALDSLKDALLDALPFGGGAGTSGQGTTGNQFASDALGGAFSGVTPLGGGLLGQFAANIGGQATDTAQNQLGDMNINLLTSRDALLGDSTQQEMQSQSTEYIIINGGS